MNLNKKLIYLIIVSIIALAIVITLKAVDINDKTDSPKGMLVRYTKARQSFMSSYVLKEVI